MKDFIFKAVLWPPDDNGNHDDDGDGDDDDDDGGGGVSLPGPDCTACCTEVLRLGRKLSEALEACLSFIRARIEGV